MSEFLDTRTRFTWHLRNNGPMELALTMFTALAVGIVLGGGLRLLLGSRTNLGFAASVLSGILGAALGASSVALILREDDIREHPFATISAAIVGTLIVVFIANRFVQPTELTGTELLAAGESAQVEFKSTARYNKRTEKRDERMELVVAKTVAALANADGGILVIGVDDDGEVLGLADDYTLMKQPDADRFELWLRDFLTKTLGGATTAGVRAEFPTVSGEEVCILRVPRSERPVFLRPGKGSALQLWVRVGNSTRELPIDQALAYSSKRFGRRGMRSPA